MADMIKLTRRDGETVLINLDNVLCINNRKNSGSEIFFMNNSRNAVVTQTVDEIVNLINDRKKFTINKEGVSSWML